MNEALHQLRVLLARLSPREQRLVAGFGALVAASLAWSLVLAPFLDGRDRVRRELDGLRAELPALASLAQQIRRGEAERGAGKGPSAPPADFSVLAFVEKAAGSSIRPESIASLTPAQRPLDGGRKESSVEVKLAGVSLGEVVALLRAIDDEASPVYVRQFAVKKRYDDASRFDVSLVAAVTLAG